VAAPCGISSYVDELMSTELNMPLKIQAASDLNHEVMANSWSSDAAHIALATHWGTVVLARTPCANPLIAE
jgi:hypothetical protein